MSEETIIKFILCVVGIVITIYNYIIIGRKTKRSKTTNSLEFCCVLQFIISLTLILALLTQKYEFHKYFNYISLEIILMSLCIQIVFWLSWFKVFRMQFAHIYSDVLYTTLNHISLFLYLATTVITFIAFFDDGKFYGIRSDYAITVLVLWFSLLELVISISTFILNYKKHKSWVKLREQQLQKLASINPTPIRVIADDRLGNFNNNSNSNTNNTPINNNYLSVISSINSINENSLSYNNSNSNINYSNYIKSNNNSNTISPILSYSNASSNYTGVNILSSSLYSQPTNSIYSNSLHSQNTLSEINVSSILSRSYVNKKKDNINNKNN